MYFDFDDFEEMVYEFNNEPICCEVPDTIREATCCFTGHRKLGDVQNIEIIAKVKSAVSYLVSRGVTNFRAGGALGFDTLASLAIISLRMDNPDIRLILDLPYPAQSEGWSDKNKGYYEHIKRVADVVNYYGENPKNPKQAKELLLKRNRVLVDNSAYCICYLTKKSGGTAYTVDYAKKRGVEVIEI